MRSVLDPNPNPYPTAEPIPWSRFRAEVLALYAPPLRARTTWIRMRQALALVGELIGPDGTTADLTPNLIARFGAGRPPAESPNTTRGLLASLSAACSYAVAQGYLRISPFAFRRQWIRPAPPRRQRHHSQAEISRILDLLSAEAQQRVGWPGWRARRLHALFAMVAYTGLRKNEALHLHVEDLDLDGRILDLVPRARRLKTVGSAQPIPIPEPLAAILAAWLPHRLDAPSTAADVPAGCAARPIPTAGACPWLFPNLMRSGPWVGGQLGARPLDKIKAAGLRAGVEGVTFQSLRHSFATHAESWGLSELMLQRILRHTNVRTQRHYRHADLNNLRAAVQSIRFGPDCP